MTMKLVPVRISSAFGINKTVNDNITLCKVLITYSVNKLFTSVVYAKFL